MRRLLLLMVALSTVSVGAVMPMANAHDNPAFFSCEATALKGRSSQQANFSSSPIANDPALDPDEDKECKDASTGIPEFGFPPDDPNTAKNESAIDAELLNAETEFLCDEPQGPEDPCGKTKARAEASVASVHITLPPGAEEPSLEIEADVLVAAARVKCVLRDGTLVPNLSGQAWVAKLFVNGAEVLSSPGKANQKITLPGGFTIVLGERKRFDTDDHFGIDTIVVRALHVFRDSTGPEGKPDGEPDDFEIIVSEAKADFHRNPCRNLN